MGKAHQIQEEIDHITVEIRKTKRQISALQISLNLLASNIPEPDRSKVCIKAFRFCIDAAVVVNLLDALLESAFHPAANQCKKNYTPNAIGDCNPKGPQTQSRRGFAPTTDP